MDPNLPDPEILFSHFCNPGVLYTHSPCLGVRGNVCWPTVLQTHGIGLTVVFSHGISPIKEKHCITAGCGIVLYCSIVNNLCDCVRETMIE